MAAKQSPRVRRDGVDVVLTDYNEFEDREYERRFWVPPNGGYVREVTAERPGTLGAQVCKGLSNRGVTLWAERDNLLSVIRNEYRSLKRKEAKYWASI